MAIDIYAALRDHPDVKLSIRLTLLELAKMAKPDGTVHVAYAYIANRIGGCKRTAQRHVKKLVELCQVLSKKVGGWIGPRRRDWNTYTFLVPFTVRRAYPPQGDRRGARATKGPSKLPGKEEGKPSSSFPGKPSDFCVATEEEKKTITDAQAALNRTEVRKLLATLGVALS